MWKPTVKLPEKKRAVRAENFAKETKRYGLCDTRVGPCSTLKKRVANSSIGG
jgi:hypothetical protein